ncbi:regulator of telomere elongation helicase 1-like [Rana temporaria]|uniref:regulator of telomere elongation helicase 1-like n=1 Tax=Rana temporaria TaxID=8407 RepID=UPI001AAC6ABC|nr:regulator of telomere elongation helicase 1-like [Rana temporaria]
MLFLVIRRMSDKTLSELELPFVVSSSFLCQVSGQAENPSEETVHIYPLPFRTVAEGPQCPQCTLRGSVPYKCTSCPFYCCKICWVKHLKETGKCPKCQSNIQKRELRQKYFLPLNQGQE